LEEGPVLAAWAMVAQVVREVVLVGANPMTGMDLEARVPPCRETRVVTEPETTLGVGAREVEVVPAVPA
jgi:hypothetical protein